MSPKEKEGEKTLRLEQSRPPLLLSLLDRSTFRIALLLIPSIIVALLLTLTITPHASPLLGDYLARSIARDLRGTVPTGHEALRLVREYGLAWCFATDQDGRLVEATASLAPPTRRILARSGKVKIRERFFYDAVVELGDGRRLHVGLPADSFTLRMNWGSLGSLLAPVPLGSVIVCLLLVWIFAIVIVEVIFAQSVRMLGNSIDKLTSFLSSSYTDEDVRNATQLQWATADVKELGRSLVILLRKLTEIKEELSRSQKWKEDQKKAKQTQLRLAAQKEAEKTVQDLTAGETGVFAIQIDRVLINCSTPYELASKLMEGLKTIYNELIDYAVFFRIGKEGSVRIEKALGFPVEGVEMLKQIDHKELTDQRNMIKRSVEIGPMQIKRMGFEPLASAYDIGKIAYFPFHYEGQSLALMAIFVGEGKSMPPERIRSLERYRDKVLPILVDKIATEASEDERWSDPVTGIGNMTYFQELLPRVLERTREQGAQGVFSIVFLGVDFTAPDLVRFPPEMKHRWLTEIGQYIGTILPVSKRLVPERGASNYIIRYHEDVICVIMEGTGPEAGFQQAEGIGAALRDRGAWAGGIPDLPISIGVASFPRDGDTPEEIVNKADWTLSYVQQMLGGRGFCDASMVPEDFRPKESTEIAGTLGVLNAADLLQSIAASDNTGVLTVENELGQTFACTWFDGLPRRASLGEFEGMAAVCEFIITFKHGQYNFQQRTPTEAEASAPSQLHSLDYCLMEAALAEDKMNAARKVVPQLNILVRAIDNPDAWMKVGNDSDVTPDEVAAMKEIFRLSDGTMTLDTIFERLTGLPMFIKWRAAALLVESEAVQWRHPGR